MKIYKTKVFAKWQSKEKLSDYALYKAAEEVICGLIDADLGSGIFKKRIAKAGAGKSGGYRTILATKIEINKLISEQKLFEVHHEKK